MTHYDNDARFRNKTIGTCLHNSTACKTGRFKSLSRRDKQNRTCWYHVLFDSYVSANCISISGGYNLPRQMLIKTAALWHSERVKLGFQFITELLGI